MPDALPDLAVDVTVAVVKGMTNPGIFSPAWLLTQELISGDDYSQAHLQIISSDLTIFEVGGLQFQVTRDSAQIATSEPESAERVRDALIGILRALPETPIGVLGINRAIHYQTKSMDEWHQVGNLLTPKDTWKDVLTDPGMRGINMWGTRPGGYAGRVSIQVEPSLTVQPGIYVSHNDHYDLEPSGSQPGHNLLERQLAPEDMTQAKGKLAIEVLAQDWEDSMKRALVAFRKIYSIGRRP